MEEINREKFQIVVRIKRFILNLDEVLVNFPKRDYISRHNIYERSLELLEQVYTANITRNKISKLMFQENIVAKIEIIDFYLELSYKKKYINDKMCNKLSKELNTIKAMVYNWIKYEK